MPRWAFIRKNKKSQSIYHFYILVKMSWRVQVFFFVVRPTWRGEWEWICKRWNNVLQILNTVVPIFFSFFDNGDDYGLTSAIIWHDASSHATNLIPRMCKPASLATTGQHWLVVVTLFYAFIITVMKRFLGDTIFIWK